MLPKYHFIFGILFSIVLYFLFPSLGILGVLTIFLASVFIDSDHYLTYILEKKNFSFIKSYQWCRTIGIKYRLLSEKQRKKVYLPLCWFHGIEFTTLLFILSFFSHFIFLIFIGVLFHFFIDYCYAPYLLLKDIQNKRYFHHFIPTYRFIKTREFKHIDHA